MFCQWKYIFGEEGKGFHSVRFANIAILDLIGTVIIAWLFSIYFRISLLISLIGAFVLGIFAHRIFCVNTTINKQIFGVV